MKQYLVKQKGKKDLQQDKTAYLHCKVECLFKKLDSIYGTQELILRASKLEAIDLMGSPRLEDKVLALQKLLQEDPTVRELVQEEMVATLDKLEDMLAENCARKVVEDELQKRIQQKMQEKYNDYLRDIELQVLKEYHATPENAQTLKKLGRLEKMERLKLNYSALEILRPSNLEEVIGQERAISSLLAKLNTPYPQHILLYGPPGVGKTTCARLALEAVKGKKGNPFKEDASFIEVDGTTLRWDPRESTNPLLGSVHDPIYQGAKKELADEGIPEPKLGLVSEAHGGILFIDEIGDMDMMLQNKLLKVLEDKRVYFESSYYDPNDERIPRYIKQIFEQGVPADFVLIGATTRSKEEINPAFRSRCMEIFFEPLTAAHTRQIVGLSARKLNINIEAGADEIISDYTTDGRGANKLLINAYSLALNEHENPDMIKVTNKHVYEAIQNSRITSYVSCKASTEAEVGKIFGIGAYGYQGTLIELEAIAFPVKNKGEGSIRFNDTAGSMAKDSVFNAASVLRKETGERVNDYDLHINIIGGGKIDGPSAGVAIYLAIFSAVMSKNVRQDVAVTGELSIQGRVKPVGAIHEKIYGARQAGIKKILIPEANLKDVPRDQKGLEIIPVKYVNEAYIHVFV